ncbi:oxidoreductase [uncultured Winogradskyella sp.]|uniref:WD40/YVTN/BNR-like repeat-containing protein n=1 Tax=uncultured Winogradskyella sp. TaxID=395353 RepID=UPI0026227AD4|nr:oxidoreductase [uncultured Winogradskyella sp.]
MRNLILYVLIVICFSCDKTKKSNINNIEAKSPISKVEIQTLLQDSLLNVRALEIYREENQGVFATSDGRYGGLSLKNDRVGIANRIMYDSLIPNFRSLALTENGTFLISISSPGILFKVDMDNYSVRYQEDHLKAFYDSIDFWNDKEGIAMGDPTEDCISIIITRDGGESWTKLSCGDLPKAVEGEAAFAASDTNIAIVGDETWIATGGMASRIMYSPDKGKSWEVYDTPIVQGKPTTGMYSLDFYDAKNGFAIGGDYTKPNDTLSNKIRTQDGGKTWQVLADGQSPGYRSCVQYIPNSNAQELVAVGFKGIDYSNNNGESWKHLSDEGFYTIRFLNDSIAYAAGRGRISKLVFK